jgi:feruloyl-CoA synthase
MAASGPRFREFEFGVTRAVRTTRGGAVYLRAENALLPYPERMTDRLVHWAHERPDQTWMARRGADDQWIHITYAQAWAQAQSIGQALLDLGLSVERPLAILSENSLEHALLALGAMTVGIPFCSVSAAYSLMSQDFGKLRHVLATITPGLVYASDWARYGKAIDATVAADVPVVTNSVGLRADGVTATIALSSLTARAVTPAVRSAMLATNGDTIVKFLFTSGSTKLPKAVINTQRMICANQQQIMQSMPSVLDIPPVLVDWPPWSHTFGGNHDFYLVLFHGGTFYINDGKPVPALIGETIRNLTEIAPTVYYDVPIGLELIAAEMKTNAALRKNLLSRLRMFFYAGAALAQPIWDSFYETEEQELGYRIPMTSGLGMTESSPFGLFVTNVHVRAGDLGLPTPGMELKLVPLGDKLEVRYRGPNITPGYWRSPEATQEAFDEEGFFRTGDAVRWIDEDDIHRGPEVRWACGRGLQARHGHLCQRGAHAREDHRGRSPLSAGCRDHGAQRARRRGDPDPGADSLPQGARAARQRHLGRRRRPSGDAGRHAGHAEPPRTECDRLGIPGGARRGARRAAKHRQGRDHGQRFDQSACRAQGARGAGTSPVCRPGSRHVEAPLVHSRFLFCGHHSRRHSP